MAQAFAGFVIAKGHTCALHKDGVMINRSRVCRRTIRVR